MALLCRVKSMRLNSISHQLKRCYFQTLVSHKAMGYCHHYAGNQSIYRWSTDLFSNCVRSFAAPIQVKKEEVKSTSGVNLNEQIKAEFVRLVSDKGHTVVPRHEALRRAKNLMLDLVEVDRLGKPPVCKIMDYNKERYKQQVKEKERTKIKVVGSIKKGDCKEVRFSGKTELKDLKMKADMARRLMERGYRVKCMAMGSEDQDLEGLLSQLSAMIEDIALVESGPRVEKKQAYFIVRHIKFGPPKKGTNKSSKVDGGNSTRSETENNNDDSCIQSPVDLKEKTCSEDYEGTTSYDDDDANSDNFDKKFDPKPVSSMANAPFNFNNPGRPSSQQPENRYAKNVPKNINNPVTRNPSRRPNYGSQLQSPTNSNYSPLPPNSLPGRRD